MHEYGGLLSIPNKCRMAITEGVAMDGDGYGDGDGDGDGGNAGSNDVDADVDGADGADAAKSSVLWQNQLHEKSDCNKASKRSCKWYRHDLPPDEILRADGPL